VQNIVHKNVYIKIRKWKRIRKCIIMYTQFREDLKVMFPIITYSYVCLPYDIPYEKAAAPITDFFQLFRIVFSKVSILAIVNRWLIKLKTI